MSNRRRPARGNRYRTGYLTSIEWFRRRARWFREEADTYGVVRCAVCLGRGTSSTLELHHLDYRGVAEVPGGGWRAGEEHTDLLAVHPDHHRMVHQLLDSDKVLGRLRNRRDASMQAIAKLRRRIIRAVMAA